MFRDRTQAGHELAKKVAELKIDKEKTLVIALPNGGVPLGEEVAKVLNVPLEILSVKKIGHPYNPEYALGAVTEDGGTFFNFDPSISKDVLEQLKVKSLQAAKDQARRLRGEYPPAIIKGKDIILVDDGIATGATVEASVKLLKQKGVRKIILAVAVSTPQMINKLAIEVDELIVLDIPKDFYSVGQFYRNFQQVTNEEVIESLERFRE